MRNILLILTIFISVLFAKEYTPSTNKYIKYKQEVKTYKTTVRGLRIRATPSLNGKIIGHFKANAIVKSKSIHKNENNYLWVKTKYGYSSKCYMQEIKKKKVLKPQCYFIPKQIVDKKTKDKYFLGASLGLTKLSSTYNEITGSFSPVSSTNDNGINFGWEIGEHLDRNTFTTLSYTQINITDVTYYNYLASYNKKLKDIPYNMYAGVVGGISYSKVSKVPVSNLDEKDSKTKATAYGVQVGTEHKIDNKLTLFTQYQYLKAKHTTTLKSGTATAEVINDDFNNISFGVRWSIK